VKLVLRWPAGSAQVEVTKGIGSGCDRGGTLAEQRDPCHERLRSRVQVDYRRNESHVATPAR